MNFIRNGSYNNCLRKLFGLVMIIFLSGFQTNRISLFEKFGSIQLITVITDNDSATTGELSFYTYDKSFQKWNKIMDSIPVNVGKNGFAWGRGLQELKIKDVKKEGDGKSPAGIFYLRTAFGYASSSEFSIKDFPYLQMDSNKICVDDIKSSKYNKIIDKKEIYQDWSAEEMKRDDVLYKWGINIGYNDNPVIPGTGSCIFFHIWRKFNSPTSGCTSMSENNLLKILNTLSADSKPIVVQGSKAQYIQMKKLYQLP